MASAYGGMLLAYQWWRSEAAKHYRGSSENGETTSKHQMAMPWRAVISIDNREINSINQRMA